MNERLIALLDQLARRVHNASVAQKGATIPPIHIKLPATALTQRACSKVPQLQKHKARSK
jgi:hypothetical protein